ncbi:MAG: methyltransferase, partial [Rubrobacter sp.]
LPPGDASSPARLLDLLLLTLVGGKERTEEEFRQLLGDAGFALSRIIPTTVGTSVIEARPIG